MGRCLRGLLYCTGRSRDTFPSRDDERDFPSRWPRTCKVLGEETPEKAEAAERVKADMNYELTERMVEYRPEHERLLYSLGLAGSAFKKVYFDPNLGVR